jgi:hypothetical protein
MTRTERELLKFEVSLTEQQSFQASSLGYLLPLCMLSAGTPQVNFNNKGVYTPQAVVLTPAIWYSREGPTNSTSAAYHSSLPSATWEVVGVLVVVNGW